MLRLTIYIKLLPGWILNVLSSGPIVYICLRYIRVILNTQTEHRTQWQVKTWLGSRFVHLMLLGPALGCSWPGSSLYCYFTGFGVSQSDHSCLTNETALEWFSVSNLKHPPQSCHVAQIMMDWYISSLEHIRSNQPNIWSVTRNDSNTRWYHSCVEKSIAYTV